MTNPVKQLIEAQRTVLDEAHTVAQFAVDAQRNTITATTQVVEAVQTAAEHNDEFARSVSDAYLDALEDSLPEDADIDRVRDAVNEAINVRADTRTRSFECVEDALSCADDLNENFSDAHEKAVEESFNALYEGQNRLEDTFVDDDGQPDNEE